MRPATRRDWPHLIPWLLALIAVLVYFNTLGHDFLLDTRRVIERSPSAAALLDSGTPRALQTLDRPMVQVSFMLNQVLNRALAFPDDHPTSYHLFNLLMHVGAGVVLYGLVRRALMAVSWTGADLRRSAPWLAGAVALLWLVHPLNTEAVSHVLGRSMSMLALFTLLALYALVRCATAGRWRSMWGLMCVVSAWAALGCRPGAVVVPMLALLLDRTVLAGSARAALRRRWAVYGGLVLPWVALPMLGLAGLPRVQTGFEGASQLAHLVAQGEVMLHYLRLAVWPHPLVLDYGWTVGEPDGGWFIGIAAMLALLSATVWGLWRKTWWGALGAALVLTLLAGLELSEAADPETARLAAEERMYLPLMPLAAAAVLLADRLMRWLIERPRARARLSGAAVGALALALAGATVARNFEYRDPIALWKTVVQRAPDNPRANQKLGEVYHLLANRLARGGALEESIAMLEQAAAQYREALAKHQRPTDGSGRPGRLVSHVAYARLGTLLSDLSSRYRQVGDEARADRLLVEAEHYLRLAVATAPHEPKTHHELGLVLLERGEVKRAAEALTRAVELGPRFAAPRYHLARLRRDAGASERALALLREAVRLEPRFAAAQAMLGEMLLERGELTEAMNALGAAQYAGYHDADLYVNLAEVHIQQGELRDAARLLYHFVNQNEHHLEGHLMLARINQRLNRARHARHAYERVLRLDPNHREAAVNLALLLTTHPDEAHRDAERAAALLAAYREEQDDATVLEALAALDAERGETARAARLQAQAITMVRDDNADDADDARRQLMQQRLDAYESGQAYRHAAYEARERRDRRVSQPRQSGG